MEQNHCISLLGSTGSIGWQSLDVIAACGMRVTALTTNRDVEQMEKQCRRPQPELAVMMDPEAAVSLRLHLTDMPIRVVEGMEGLLGAVSLEATDMVLIAVVGIAGLRPTLAVIRAGKRIALASKEALVCAGELVGDATVRSGSQVVPMDSERSAIFQCLQGCQDRGEVRRLILIASDGPFQGWKGKDFAGVTVEQALAYPNWNMGAKISVDSAIMMNKGLEFTEAMRLYHMPSEKISIVAHQESIVHSLVEYCDHAVLAQLGMPNIRPPIQYVLTWPGRVAAVAEPLDLLSCPSLALHAPGYVVFPCLALVLEAAHTGGNATVVLNEANGETAGQFLAGQLSFSGVAEQVAHAMTTTPAVQSPSLGNILDADQAAQETVQGHRPDTH